MNLMHSASGWPIPIPTHETQLQKQTSGWPILIPTHETQLQKQMHITGTS